MLQLNFIAVLPDLAPQGEWYHRHRNHLIKVIKQEVLLALSTSVNSHSLQVKPCCAWSYAIWDRVICQYKFKLALLSIVFLMQTWNHSDLFDASDVAKFVHFIFCRVLRRSPRTQASDRSRGLWAMLQCSLATRTHFACLYCTTTPRLICRYM